jgi:SPP1 family predicted phage head-tail adaptor
MLQSKVQIGEFDTKISIEKNTPTRHAVTNEEKSSWSVLAAVWSKKISKGSSLRYEADQQTALGTDQFLIRYSSTVSVVDETMRISLGGEYYYISGVHKEKREGWIMIDTEKRDNG